jgi:hypothetical protein
MNNLICLSPNKLNIRVCKKNRKNSLTTSNNCWNKTDLLNLFISFDVNEVLRIQLAILIYVQVCITNKILATSGLTIYKLNIV